MSPPPNPDSFFRVRDRVVEVPIAPSEAQRAVIAHWLGVGRLDALKAQIALSRAGADDYAYRGHFEADVVQACVVTLEPVAEQVDETFEVAFWPEDDMPAPASGSMSGPVRGPSRSGRRRGRCCGCGGWERGRWTLTPWPPLPSPHTLPHRARGDKIKNPFPVFLPPLPVREGGGDGRGARGEGSGGGDAKIGA